jgi:hypothetical protein
VRRLLFGLWLLIWLSAGAAAEEVIRSFVSDVTVNADASLTVRETIAVNAEGIDIRRGIFRDFPTTYLDGRGQRMRAGFEVLSVKRDGQAEPYRVESLSNGKRIRIGDADVFLAYGQHGYEIVYRTTRQIGFFEDFDELYWNVTGNGWQFAIDEAIAIVRLPPGARIRQHSEYTGRQGSTANHSRVLTASGSEFRAETVRRLLPGEGFTIAIAWQKGLVQPPSAGDETWWWLADNVGLFTLIATLVAAGLFYALAWLRVGRDPPRGTIIPLFTPPAGLGPAGSRFVWRQGFDDRTFAAAVVGLAVKGRARIVDDDGEYEIEKKSDAGPPLVNSERALFAALPAGTLQLKQSNHARVGAARSALANALSREYEGILFLRNIGWFWAGAAISVAGLLISALLLPAEDGLEGLFAVGWLGIWWGVILGVAWGAVRGAFAARGVLKKLSSLGVLLFLVPFMAGGVVTPVMLFSTEGSPLLYALLAAAVILGVMNWAFFFLLKAPTVPGRRILDQLEGFRMYMTTAEEERLQVLHPPDRTPELFERYLPYALALDCENQWNAKFAAVLAAAAAAGAAAPSWYSGSNWHSGNMGGFTESLGSGLASTISSASTAPGSSSGSGGGGSSGGGGGGGGGGGW